MLPLEVVVTYFLGCVLCHSAQRFFWAARIFAFAAALITRFFLGLLPNVKVLAGGRPRFTPPVPVSRRLTSLSRAISSSIAANIAVFSMAINISQAQRSSHAFNPVISVSENFFASSM